MRRLLPLFTLMAVAFSAAMPQNAGEPPPQGEELVIRGRVRLLGSMPLSRLAISDDEDQDWYLEGADRERLAPYEQQMVTVKGRGEYEDIILENGRKFGLRRFLLDVAILP
jgi:hypothetical protein